MAKYSFLTPDRESRCLMATFGIINSHRFDLSFCFLVVVLDSGCASETNQLNEMCSPNVGHSTPRYNPEVQRLAAVTPGDHSASLNLFKEDKT